MHCQKQVFLTSENVLTVGIQVTVLAVNTALDVEALE